MVDEQIIQTFERDGVAVIPQVLTKDQVNRLVEVGDRWVASDYQTMRQAPGKGDSDGFRNCIALDDAFLELIAAPGVLPYLVRLLGPDIKLLTSHLIYRKPAPPDTDRRRRSPGWHRDFAKAQRSLGHARMPRLDIKAAFCLNDLPTPGCGGTLFVPGSHLLKTPLKFSATEDPQGAVEPTVRAGDCILFENCTWHAGGANLSAHTRKVVMMGYTYVWIQPSDFDIQPEGVLAKAADLFGDIGLQLLSGLPRPVHFDFNYDSKPLGDWAETHNLVQSEQTTAY